MHVDDESEPIARLLCWNMGYGRAKWTHVESEADVDVAMLQEAPNPSGRTELETVPAAGSPWHIGRAHSRTAIARLSERVVVTEIASVPLEEEQPGHLCVSRMGTITVATVKILATDEELVVASVYSQWEAPASGGTDYYADASMHRILSDLSPLLVRRDKPVIIAGDFNSVMGDTSDAMGERLAARNAGVFDRMAGLGLRLAGPRAPHGQQVVPTPTELPADTVNVPTFGAKPINRYRQIDYCYVTEEIAHRTTVVARNGENEWGPSDHCQLRIDLAPPHDRLWSEDTFIAEIVAVHGPALGRLAASLMYWARTGGLRVAFGSGHEGEMHIDLDRGRAGRQPLFIVRTRGDLAIQFQWMTDPFGSPQDRAPILQALNAIPGIDMSEKLNGKPAVSLSSILDGEARSAFLSVFTDIATRTLDANQPSG